MDSNIVRFILLIIVIAVPFFFRYPHDSVSKHILGYLILNLVSELITLFYSGYNLHLYSAISFCQLVIISILVGRETQNTRVSWIVVASTFVVLLGFGLSDYHSMNLLGRDIEIRSDRGSPISLHQFFDFSAILCISQLILLYHWLLNVVNREDIRPALVHMRYIYIFAFIVYFGGSFFMLAFGRLLLASFEVWYSLWSTIFYPVLFIFYIIILTGLLWKKTY